MSLPRYGRTRRQRDARAGRPGRSLRTVPRAVSVAVATVLVVVLLPAAPAWAGARHSQNLGETSHPDWMGLLPDGANLAALSIPGTHDTMAWGVTPVANTQDSDLSEQLNSGIRALDIRAEARHYIEVYFERGVIEITALTVLTCGDDGLVQPAEVLHDVITGPQREPVQVDCRTRLQVRSSRHRASPLRDFPGDCEQLAHVQVPAAPSQQRPPAPFPTILTRSWRHQCRTAPWQESESPRCRDCASILARRAPAGVLTPRATVRSRPPALGGPITSSGVRRDASPD
jgi:hypothetical protein